VTNIGTCLDYKSSIDLVSCIEYKNHNNLTLDILHEFRKIIDTSGTIVFYNTYCNDELKFVLKSLLYNLKE